MVCSDSGECKLLYADIIKGYFCEMATAICFDMKKTIAHSKRFMYLNFPACFRSCAFQSSFKKICGADHFVRGLSNEDRVK